MADEETRVPGRERQDALEYAALRVVIGILRALPERAATGLAAGVTAQAMRLTGRLRAIGLANLEIAFPEKDPAWREATLREAYRNLGRLAGELAHFSKLTPENIRAKVGFASSGDERRWRTCMAGGARVLVTGHFGNWELLVQAQGLLGHPATIVHREFKNPRADQILSAIRGRVGTQALPKRSAARELLKRLKRGELITLPIDQRELGGGGAPVPFFGRPALTALGPARLAQLVQVPLQVGVLARRGDSLQHEIIVQEPIFPPPKRDKDPALLIEMMTKVNASFEDCIRRYPEQWLWVHRRWHM